MSGETVPPADDPILVTKALTRHFGGGRDLLGRRQPVLRAVDGIDLQIPRGSTLGLVGESGCGKSTTGRMIVGLLEPTSGEILLDGARVACSGRAEKLAFHRKVQMVFQDPLGSLNPRKTVRQILEGPLETLGRMDRDARRERVRELMDLVSLRPEFIDRYPHEFSGGQCQRIAVARALGPEPELLVLDEPVSALDVSVQAQVLHLLRDLQQRLGLSYLFISHDLAVVESLCDDIAVMYFGQVVEQAPREQLFRAPRHDYTRLLLDSIPVPGERKSVTM